jgi:hypothetical protein
VITRDDLTPPRILLLEELCGYRDGAVPATSRETARRVKGRNSKPVAALARQQLITIELRGGHHVMWLTQKGRQLIDELQMCG